MPTPTTAAVTVKKSSKDGSTAAATATEEEESCVEIIVHINETALPIILAPEMCTSSTTWGELCKLVVEKYLTTADPSLILDMLVNISPTERLTHYLLRYGDGYSSIIRVIWSSSTESGSSSIIPLVPAYIDANVVLKPSRTEYSEDTYMTMPHLPVQYVVEEPLPTVINVDLCITPAVSSTEISFPSNIARRSVVYLKEHDEFLGCVDSFRIVAADDGLNNILPPAHVSLMGAPSAAATSVMSDVSHHATMVEGRKRKAPLQIGEDAEVTPKKLKFDGDKDENVATMKKVSAQALEETLAGEPEPTSTSSHVSLSPEKNYEMSSEDEEASVKESLTAVAIKQLGDDEDSFTDFGTTDIPAAVTSVDSGNTDNLTADAPPSSMEKKVSTSRQVQKALQQGYHPITKLQVRNCICGSSECRKIVWQYAAMGNEKMTKYIVIPNHPPNANNKTRKYKLKFLHCIDRYFPHWADKPRSEKTVNYLSITHFPPAHRDVLWNRPKSWTKRWRIPLSVGRISGLDEQHKCRFGGDTFHFATPILHRNAIAIELRDTIRSVLLQKCGTVLNDSQTNLLKKFQKSNGYTPITKNDYGIHMQVLVASEKMSTKTSTRLKGKQITCQCKQNHPNCVHSECANNNEHSRECNQSNCSFGEADCGNRFTTKKQVNAQNCARFIVTEFKSDKYSDPRVGSGAKAVVSISENEIIGEYIGEVREREEGISNYCVDIGNGYVIDAEKKGNAMRFIQHSCDPNCDLIVRVHQDRKKRAWIRARKPIAVGEWITYKYHSNPSVLQQFFFNNQGCVCGSECCLKPRKIVI